jgi:hypothetical protein
MQCTLNSYVKYVGKEIFEEGVCTSNWARVLENHSYQDRRELYKTPDLVADIKIRGLEWFVDVIRMDQVRLA